VTQYKELKQSRGNSTRVSLRHGANNAHIIITHGVIKLHP